MAFQRLVAELNKEQEALIAANKLAEKGEAVAPWVGAPNEDVLREECLSLSTVSNKRSALCVHTRAPAIRSHPSRTWILGKWTTQGLLCNWIP